MRHRRLFTFGLLGAVSLMPVGLASIDFAGLIPWQLAERDQCVGNFALPSGVLLEVRQRDHKLVIGGAGWAMRRSAPWCYSAEKGSLRVRFLPDGRGTVNSLRMSGVCPSTVAKRVGSSTSCASNMVPVGDHAIRVNVTGREHDGPTVLLETGPLGGLEGVSQWQADVAKFARVVAYDHPGTGGSQVGPEPQSARVVVTQLRIALRELGVEPPFVVAGMSMGGPYSQVFAHQFPSETAGLVWIDPTPDWQHLHAWCATNAPTMQSRIRRSMQWTDLSISTGLRDAPEPGRFAEWQAMDETWEQVRAAKIAAVPVIQITGARDYRTREGAATKVRYFTDWLDSHLNEAKHILAEESGHGVYATEPQLVLDAIRSIVDQNR